MEFTGATRIRGAEHRERLNGSRSLVADKDDIAVLFFSALHTTIKDAARQGVKEAVWEVLLDIPGVRAWRWVRKKLKRGS